MRRQAHMKLRIVVGVVPVELRDVDAFSAFGTYAAGATSILDKVRLASFQKKI